MCSVGSIDVCSVGSIDACVALVVTCAVQMETLLISETCRFTRNAMRGAIFLPFIKRLGNLVLKLFHSSVFKFADEVYHQSIKSEF